MTKKTIIGVGHDAWFALRDAQDNLPFPINSSRYAEIDVSNPEKAGDKNYFVKVSYTLREEPSSIIETPNDQKSSRPRRRPIEEVVEEALKEPNYVNPLTRDEVKKMIDESVENAVQRYFKDWFNVKE